MQLGSVLSQEIFAVAIHVGTVPMGLSSIVDVVEELQPLFIRPRRSIEGRQAHAAIAQGRDLRAILAELVGWDLRCTASHGADGGREVFD